MNPNKALWEKGDFTRIAATMRESGEALVARLGVTEGRQGPRSRLRRRHHRAARRRNSAPTCSASISPATSWRRATGAPQEAGLANCRFQEGDASNLEGLADKSFDLVVSIFGAMFAPKPFDVAKEMVRVTKPGGRIVMGNWIPGDPTLVAQILKISAAYSPPPPEGFVSPMTWGIESNVVERFGGAGMPTEKISCERDTYVFHFPGSPADFVAAFRNYYGPTMNAFEAAEKNGKADDLRKELEALFTSQEQKPGSKGHLHSGDLPARDGLGLSKAQRISHGLSANAESAPSGTADCYKFADLPNYQILDEFGSPIRFCVNLRKSGLI